AFCSSSSVARRACAVSSEYSIVNTPFGPCGAIPYGAAGPGSVFPVGALHIKITAGFVGPEHPHRLQIGVDDGGTHEFHAALLQILRDRVRQRRGRAANFPQGPASGPVPEIAVETAPLPPDGRQDDRKRVVQG